MRPTRHQAKPFRPLMTTSRHRHAPARYRLSKKHGGPGEHDGNTDTGAPGKIKEHEAHDDQARHGGRDGHADRGGLQGRGGHGGRKDHGSKGQSS